MAKYEQAMVKLDLGVDEARLMALEEVAARADFWSDSEAAEATMKQIASLKRHIGAWREPEDEVRQLLELAELGGDESMDAEIEQRLEALEAAYAEREFELKLGGEYDKQSGIVSIYAGTGGTDAQDWAGMLLRMYLRWCERRGFAVDVVDQSAGEEAGLKSVTFEVEGAYAYGWLKSEAGVHRLVRLSPFNADNLRQTSFALVEVIPQLPTQTSVDINPDDLRIDTYRSSGHGGQSVNTTDSAVRITHLPTKITVSVQNERSQLKNKQKAMSILASRLYLWQKREEEAKMAGIRGEATSAAWGNQIRSYVLHPYTKVKDHRTEYETSNAAGVLDGELDAVMESYLAERIGE